MTHTARLVKTTLGNEPFRIFVTHKKLDQQFCCVLTQDEFNEKGDNDRIKVYEYHGLKGNTRTYTERLFLKRFIELA